MKDVSDYEYFLLCEEVMGTDPCDIEEMNPIKIVKGFDKALEEAEKGFGHYLCVSFGINKDGTLDRLYI